MGLGSRTGARHQTVALVATSARSTDYYDFTPGQRVMTVDGYPGVVTAVQDGPVPGNEAYDVTLDGGLGGGLYSTSQLRPIAATTAAAEHTAADDYPELREVLVSRPDIAPDKVASLKTAEDDYETRACPYCQGSGHLSTADDRDVQTCWACDGSGRMPHKHAHCGDCPTDLDQHSDEPLLEQRHAVKTVCRNCHETMLAPQDEEFPTCPHCGTKTQAGEPYDWAHDSGSGLHQGKVAAEQDPSGGPSTDEALDADPLADYTASATWTDAHQPDGAWQPGNEHDYASHVRCPNCDSERALVSADGTTTCQGCGYNTVGRSAAKVARGSCPLCGGTNATMAGGSLQCPDCGEGMPQDQWGSPSHDIDRHFDDCAHCKGAGCAHCGFTGEQRIAKAADEPIYKDWVSCPDCGLSSAMHHSGEPCPLCGGRLQSSTNPNDEPRQGHWAKADYRFLTIAALDPEFRWHVTAAWSDVRAKAKRLRTEGRVRIVAAHGGVVSGEVKGDHHVYQTSLLKAPATNHVASWECGCKWAAYSWGRSAPYKRFEGRMCSHALAMHYEAQARGMFGRTIDEDQKAPAWLRPRTRVVVEYDRADQRNVSRPAQPRQRDVGRAFSVRHEGLGAGATGSVVATLIRTARTAGDDADETRLALHVVGIKVAAPNNAPGNHPFASPVSADTGRYKMCSYCHGQGCEHCGWDGLVNSHSAAANDPFNEFGHDEDMAQPHVDNGNPASTGWATGPDPSFGEDERGLKGVGIDAMSALDEGCDLCGSHGHNSLQHYTVTEGDNGEGHHDDADLDPWAIEPHPYVHGSYGDYCEDCGSTRDDPAHEGQGQHFDNPGYDPHAQPSHPGYELPGLAPRPFAFTHTNERPGSEGATYAPFEPDRSRLFNLNTLNADPEPALPQTDGEVDDTEGTPSAPGHAIAAASGEDDIVAAFQRQASHLDPGRSAGLASSDIAQAARAHLAKTALKDFTPAEQQELISEGAAEALGAGNLANLDLSGTHYEQIEAALALADQDDEGWLA